MKKFTFALLAIVVSVGVHAQIKHNKFATRIKFDQFNTSTFWQTEVSEIKDNSGYFLSNRKDNSGQVSPSLVKLDVDGNIVFDTIYDFLPNNIGGFINIQNTITTSTNHTMLFSTGYLQAQNSLAAPYICLLYTSDAADD